MKQYGLFIFCLGLFFISNSEGLSLSGRIIDENSPATPITNTSISIKNQSVTVYTDTSGRFSINFTPSGVLKNVGPSQFSGKIIGSRLFLTLSSQAQLKIELFNLQGCKIKVLFHQKISPGIFSLSLSSIMKGIATPGFFILKIKIGSTALIGTMVSIVQNSGAIVDKSCAFSQIQMNSVIASSPTKDSLSIYKLGYNGVTLPISASTAPLLGDIKLSKTQEELNVERKADSLLALMSLEQKAAQMAQVQTNEVTDEEIAAGGYGSVFNGGEQPVTPNKAENWAKRLDQIQTAVLTSSPLKIPIIYGIDAVHGNAKVTGSTIFPHNIGLGCTLDSSIVRQAGEITAEECAAVGIHLTFAPAISVVRNEKWGRTYEGFGETPEINSMMGSAFIRGMQGDGDISKSTAIAGCAKHYLGDGATDGGVNGGTVSISDQTMRATQFPPYAAAARENVASVMPSYNSWKRGDQEWRQSVDSYTLTQMLKTELGFDGFCLSDYNAIPLAAGLGGTDYNVDCVSKSVNAGMDMAMIAGKNYVVANFVNAIVSAVKTDNKIPLSRVNDAVKRILRIKFRMHLWDHPKSNPELVKRIGCAEHRAIARDCVRKSLVLLKNDANALPLGKSDRIVVVGPWANSLGLQCGGWTLNWQGNPRYNGDSLPGDTTIFQGLQKIGGSNVRFDSTGANLANVDKIIVVIGEIPYAEGLGDDGFSDADLGYDPNADWGGLYKNQTRSVSLSGQPSYGLLAKCAAAGKPLICILVSGRPMVISSEDLAKCKALIAAWLPGSEGQGVAEVLYGVFNFSGKLTHSWPSSAGQIPINTGTAFSDEQKGSGGAPLFEYGFGLRY
jgi:beta-glucosidase